jgi:hypothetical protein
MLGSSFASASPNSAANTMSGSIVPSLAVAITFAGTSDTSQLANVGGVVSARRRRRAQRRGGRRIDLHHAVNRRRRDQSDDRDDDEQR